MVFNATFNNISVISWQSVLFVEKTGVPGENHQSINIKGNLLTNVHEILVCLILIKIRCPSDILLLLATQCIIKKINKHLILLILM